MESVDVCILVSSNNNYPRGLITRVAVHTHILWVTLIMSDMIFCVTLW